MYLSISLLPIHIKYNHSMLVKISTISTVYFYHYIMQDNTLESRLLE